MKEKIKIIVLTGILCLMSACAQEGPFESGKLECEVSASSVTSTTAIVRATIIYNNGNVLLGGDHYNDFHVCLTDKSPEEITKIADWDFIYGEYNYDNNNIYFFDNLKPNTTYYPIVNAKSDLNGDEKGYDALYINGYSFTTSKEGDYSSLGEIRAKILETSYRITSVCITLPTNLNFYNSNYLEISTHQNMKDAVVGRMQVEISQQTMVFQFDDLSPNTYYLRLGGEFKFEGFKIGDSKNPIKLNVANIITIQ